MTLGAFDLAKFSNLVLTLNSRNGIYMIQNYTINYITFKVNYIIAMHIKEKEDNIWHKTQDD